MDLNGSLRAFCPISYTGLDREAGCNVDMVVDGYPWPLDDVSYDMVTSTSCLEHDPRFWLTFAEMGRVLKPGGTIYVNAPHNGPIHNYPVDCWRFYPDAATALATLVPGLQLIESFLAKPSQGAPGWIDFVAVFGKGRPTPPQAYLNAEFA